MLRFFWHIEIIKPEGGNMTALIRSIVWIEKLAGIFENLIDRILEIKEKILITLIKNRWPAWLSANKLTGSRLIVALAIFPWVILVDYRGNEVLAIILIVMILTDLIDGVIARTLNQTSALGSLLDKIADKTLVMPLGVIEFWSYDPWLVGLSLFGMSVILFLAFVKFFRSSKTVVPENTAGKLCSACYSLAIIIAIWPDWQIWADHLGWGGFFVGMASIMQNFHRHFLAGK